MSGGYCPPRDNYPWEDFVEGGGVIVSVRACVPGENYSEVIVWRAKALGIIVLGVGSHWRQLSAGYLSRAELFRGNCELYGGKSPGGNCPGESSRGGSCLGSSCPGGNYSGVIASGEKSGG